MRLNKSLTLSVASDYYLFIHYVRWIKNNLNPFARKTMKKLKLLKVKIKGKVVKKSIKKETL